ncbi:MAG: NAD(P)/FAD-dependent oxidoreductase [Acidobacteria bacterium]|nr:NAD(P)/FAD-dependent oxidoreductase [Acidobacteriota bacterium]
MRYDAIIIGAGPAGLAAARAAKHAGKQTLIIDDNHGPGGQIWRGRDGIELKGVDRRFSTQITDLNFSATQIILATGARELFLPFPGWTLPHVLGAGGLQAMAKQGLNVQGKSVVIAGSGPLLLAVASNLKKAGADITLIAEQAPWSSLLHFGSQLLRWPSKLTQALQLFNINYTPNLWPIEAKPGEVLMSNGKTYPCNYLACAFGLLPNLELARLANCKIENGFVKVNRHQQTSVQGIYAVGELTGIGGLEKAEAEGEAAGAGTATLGNHQDFVKLLTRTFKLRDELKQLAQPDTILCRCEDIPFSRTTQCSSMREAKLQTRCGMGPCQGRICGPILEQLYGWPSDSVRQPLYPVPLKSLIQS